MWSCVRVWLRGKERLTIEPGFKSELFKTSVRKLIKHINSVHTKCVALSHAFVVYWKIHVQIFKLTMRLFKYRKFRRFQFRCHHLNQRYCRVSVHLLFVGRRWKYSNFNYQLRFFSGQTTLYYVNISFTILLCWLSDLLCCLLLNRCGYFVYLTIYG